MFARGTILSLASLGILTVFAISIRAGDNPESAKGDASEEAAKCERLVTQLVNPDPPPFKKSFVLRLPKGMDEQTLREKQAKILAAYKD